MSQSAAPLQRGSYTGARWASLALLITAAILSFVDRQIVSLLVGPIKRDLGLSDVEISLVQGFAFAVFYALAALPFGMLVDRVSRRVVLAAGILAWSIMTAVCGAARSFSDLFVARMGVGVGEASLGPAAHSLIADLFTGRALPMAMGLYGLGVAAGAGIATVVGGQVAGWAQTHQGVAIAGLGLVEGWRLAFAIVAAPGAIVALAVYLVIPREFAHARSFGRGPEPGGDGHVAIGDFVSRVSRPGALILAGLSCATAASFAGLGWAPAFLQREFGLTAQQAGLYLGGLIVAGAIPGGVFWSLIAARTTKGGPGPAALSVLALSTGAAAPFAVVGYLAGELPLALTGMFAATFLGAGLAGLGPTIVQAVTPSHLRGRASAVQLLVTSVLGMTAGPLAVAVLTDHVFASEALVGHGLAIAVAAFSIAAAALLLAARGAYGALCGLAGVGARDAVLRDDARADDRLRGQR